MAVFNFGSTTKFASELHSSAMICARCGRQASAATIDFRTPDTAILGLSCGCSELLYTMDAT